MLKESPDWPSPEVSVTLRIYNASGSFSDNHRGGKMCGMQNKTDKKVFPYLDALNASFAVVAFDVNINLCVANKAEWQK